LCGIVFIADYVDVSAEVEFLNALVIPLRDSSGITFMRGVDGFPAFSFASTANVQRPANELVYRVGPDFSFVASILPLTSAGGSVPAALLCETKFDTDMSDDLSSQEVSTGYTLPSRSNLHFKFLTFGHSGAQP